MLVGVRSTQAYVGCHDSQQRFPGENDLYGCEADYPDHGVISCLPLLRTLLSNSVLCRPSPLMRFFDSRYTIRLPVRNQGVFPPHPRFLIPDLSIKDFVQSKKDYLAAQVGNPEGPDKPNKKVRSCSSGVPLSACSLC